VLGLADLIATAGLATDDPPYEGSGPARSGWAWPTLQHMDGSRCRALAPWDRGRWVAACCAAGAGSFRLCRREVAGRAGGSGSATGPAVGPAGATSQDYENARCDQRDCRGILKAHGSRRTTCESVRQVRPAAGCSAGEGSLAGAGGARRGVLGFQAGRSDPHC